MRRGNNKSKMLIGGLAVFVLAAAVVFATALVCKKDYASAAKIVNEIVEARADIEAVFKEDLKSDSFEGAYKKSSDGLNELKKCSAYEDESVKKLVDEADGEFVKITTVYNLEQFYKDISSGDSISNEVLEKYSSSDNEWISGAAKGLKEFREKTDAFAEKYNDAEARKSDDFLTDASEVQLMGLEYTKKYEGADLESMLGFKPEEISSFYDKMEELNAYLTEKE